MTNLDSVLKGSDITSVILHHWRIYAFVIMVLEKTLGSPLGCKEIQPVHPKGDQSWIFIRRADAETEAPILWPPDVKIWLIRKDPDAGKDSRQQEKVMTEDDMILWHLWLNRHKFEQAQGDGEGQGSLTSCSLWGCKKSDTTEWLNHKCDDLMYIYGEMITIIR